ncbi:MAG: sterol desaturase family protein [Chitinophagaceae bacterium]|jgi:sterol desaturase/sphingolipid hydroxylase (fatty acid hydroxylase superfamily)|nr:sterol desaturase family protein [Chitinophagaceae bacterium]
MESLLQYFQELEKHPGQRLLFFVGSLMLLWILENAIPLVHMHYKKSKGRHAAVNLGFTLIHFIVHTILAIFIVMIADWTKAHQFGLVYWLKANVLWTIVISALTLDFFAGWLCHIVEHKVPLFWRFHIIHHADNNVDVTTGLRHHPLESIWRGLFFFAGILVSGSPMYAVMIFQTLLVAATGFTHANISLPAWLDKGLSYFLVSPNMHKIHHHWKQPYTDSNYGAVFSIWDRLLGTFSRMDPAQLRYGLDRYYPNEKDEDFIALMKKPFQKLED